MITTMNAFMIYLFSSKETAIIYKSHMVSTEVMNIMIMSFLTMTLMFFMKFKSINKEEKKMMLTAYLATLLALISFSTNSPLKFLIMMEMIIFPLCWNILKTSKDKDKKESLKFMVIMNTLGSIPLMMFITQNNNILNEYESTYNNSIMMYILSITIFATKTPIFMSHFWLTKTHVSASGNCSMILASIMIKMGTMGVYKFIKPFSSSKLMNLFLSMSLWSSILLSLIMMRFFDLKTLIATSSILHMGMIIPLIMMNKSTPMMASIMMMSAHGLISYFMFYLITVKYEMSENRTINFTYSSESQSKLLSMMIFLLMFLNLGVPPLMNFMSEVMMMSSLMTLNSKYLLFKFMSVLLINMLFVMQSNFYQTFGKSNKESKKWLMEKILMNFYFFFFWIILITMIL